MSDVTTLAFAASYDRIRRMRPFPVDSGRACGTGMARGAATAAGRSPRCRPAVLLNGLFEAIRAAPL